MTLVTLIGERLAKEDEEFIYLGPNNDCRRCKLKTVCFNLKPGRRYKIIDIRDKRHSCELHEGNAAVVEVSVTQRNNIIYLSVFRSNQLSLNFMVSLPAL